MQFIHQHKIPINLGDKRSIEKIIGDNVPALTVWFEACFLIFCVLVFLLSPLSIQQKIADIFPTAGGPGIVTSFILLISLKAFSNLEIGRLKLVSREVK
ncbi:MAG: hypothetical protein EOP45_09065 [Sphingobacteriaceae bacterium]|nr:MAG: hypothetical protein EOP45_09065 [Sphingobacteriaceae bacterium]